MTKTAGLITKWLAGKYPCLLVPAELFQEPKFKAWAKGTSEAVEQELDRIAGFGVPPEIILNILATYHRLEEEDRRDREAQRVGRRRRKSDIAKLLAAAEVYDRVKAKISLGSLLYETISPGHKKEGGAEYLREQDIKGRYWMLKTKRGTPQRRTLRFYNPDRDYGTSLTAIPAALRSHALELDQKKRSNLRYCLILALLQVLKQYKMKGPQPVVEAVLNAARPDDEKGIGRVPYSWQFEINGPLDDLFCSPPPPNAFVLVLGEPSARQRLRLLKPVYGPQDRKKAWRSRRRQRATHTAP